MNLSKFERKIRKILKIIYYPKSIVQNKYNGPCKDSRTPLITKILKIKLAPKINKINSKIIN